MVGDLFLRVKVGKKAGYERKGMIPKSGCLYGMEGEYSSSELVMNDGDEVILGRDPKCATLVFSYPKISRRHCGIRYNGTVL